MKVLPVLALSVFSHVAGAQTDYAVGIKGDTLKGEIKILSYDNVDRVQILKDREKTTLRAMEIRSLWFRGELYRPQLWDKSYRFMKVLKDGYLSLLAYRYPDKINYDGRLLAKRDGALQDLPNIGFKKIMTSFLSDCADTQDKLAAGTWSRKDVELMVDEYNACLEEKTTARTPPPSPVIPILQELEIFANDLAQRNSLPNKGDIADMVNDIRQKISEKKAVPNYLAAGVTEALAPAPDLQARWKALAQQIK